MSSGKTQQNVKRPVRLFIMRRVSWKRCSFLHVTTAFDEEQTTKFKSSGRENLCSDQWILKPSLKRWVMNMNRLRSVIFWSGTNFYIFYLNSLCEVSVRVQILNETSQFSSWAAVSSLCCCFSWSSCLFAVWCFFILYLDGTFVIKRSYKNKTSEFLTFIRQNLTLIINKQWCPSHIRVVKVYAGFWFTYMKTYY